MRFVFQSSIGSSGDPRLAILFRQLTQLLSVPTIIEQLTDLFSYKSTESLRSLARILLELFMPSQRPNSIDSAIGSFLILEKVTF